MSDRCQRRRNLKGEGHKRIMKVVFDFNHIPDVATFYLEFIRQFALNDDFGANLDALWDVLTGGGISLPVKIEFIHFNRDRTRHFVDLVRVFTEAEEELSGRLRFNMTAEQDPQSN